MPFAPDQMTLDSAKGFVDRLMRSQKKTAPESWPPKRTHAQETIAHVLDYPNWHCLQRDLKARSGSRPIAATSPPKVVLPPQSTCSAPVYYTKTPEGSRMDLTWNAEAGNIKLIGPAAARLGMLLELSSSTSPTANSCPVLWLRSNRSANHAQHTPGFEFLDTTSGHQFFDAINQVLARRPTNDCCDAVMGLLDDQDYDGEGAIWRRRAQSLLGPVLSALVYLRDHEGAGLDGRVLRDTLFFENLELLRKDSRLPLEIKERLDRYVVSLPGYTPGKLSDIASDMHGYVQMMFSKVLGIPAEYSSAFSMRSKQLVSINEAVQNYELAEHTKWHLLSVLIDLWLEDNKGARICLDGFSPGSGAYAVVEKHWRRWNARGALVLVGADRQGDAPFAWSTSLDLGQSEG